MPTVNLNYNTIKTGLGKQLTDEQIKERISMLGTDLDDFSKQGVIVEVFPNRPDMLAEFGFVRALSSFIGAKTGLRDYKTKPSGKQVLIRNSVSSVRPYTACAIVKNLKLDDEKIEQLIQLQEKLHLSHCRNRKKGAIGIYPSDKLKYPIEYSAEDPRKIKFIPLGESSEMTGLQILSSHKTGREFGHLLEGKQKFPVFRDANGSILSMPPIINSEFTGKITADTAEVFVECSGFDFKFLKKLLNILICEMADMGGEVHSMQLIYQDRNYVTPDLGPEKFRLDEGYVEKLLGQKVNIKKCLGSMGHGYRNGVVEVPCYRVDVLHQIDLVEDIAIAHGYENFKPEIPNISTIGNETQIEKFKRKVVERMLGVGLNEVWTFGITNNRVQNELMGSDQQIIEFSNFKSSEQSGLRTSMIPSLMEVFQANAKNEYPQKIFDIGTLFIGDTTQETGVLEEEWLSLGLCGSEENFTKAKQILEFLLKGFKQKPSFKRIDAMGFIPGRAAAVCVKGKQIGIIGEIHPGVLLNFKLEMPAACFEINLNALLRLL